MEPFTPAAARKRHGEKIPESIIATINELLAERIYRDSIEITQAELTESIERRGYSEEEFFDKGWINFEEYYNLYGWRATYSRPNGEGKWVFQIAPGN